jgi:hypothetical protein
MRESRHIAIRGNGGSEFSGGSSGRRRHSSAGGGGSSGGGRQIVLVSRLGRGLREPSFSLAPIVIEEASTHHIG